MLTSCLIQSGCHVSFRVNTSHRRAGVLPARRISVEWNGQTMAFPSGQRSVLRPSRATHRTVHRATISTTGRSMITFHQATRQRAQKHLQKWRKTNRRFLLFQAGAPRWPFCCAWLSRKLFSVFSHFGLDFLFADCAMSSSSFSLFLLD